MSTATVEDLQTHFDELAARLASGETIQICQDGKPVARLVPEVAGGGVDLLGVALGMADFGSDFDEPLDLDWEACR